MSDARRAFLTAVRTALFNTERAPALTLREPRARPVREELLELFVERAEDDHALVHRCGPDEVEDTLARLLGQRQTVVPDGFPWPVPNPVSEETLDSAGLDHSAIVTAATLGVATTGTVVLTHGVGQDRHALSLVPDLHVCVLLAEQLVTGVPEAIAALDPHTPKTWVSGPAASGEIELKHVEPVDGPRTLRVVLVEQGS